MRFADVVTEWCEPQDNTLSGLEVQWLLFFSHFKTQSNITCQPVAPFATCGDVQLRKKRFHDTFAMYLDIDAFE